MVDIKDLEEYWRDLRVGRVEFTAEADGPETVIDRAVGRFQEALPEIIKDAEFAYGAAGTGPLTRLLTNSLRVFAHALYEEQRRQDASLLIQLFLEGTGTLAPEDIKGFLQALPRQLIDRILARLEGTRNGLHALLSLEVLWRDRTLDRDYELRRDQDGKIVVTFYPKEVPVEMSFRLRELFGGNDLSDEKT
jgi:hypothetical protein